MACVVRGTRKQNKELHNEMYQRYLEEMKEHSDEDWLSYVEWLEITLEFTEELLLS